MLTTINNANLVLSHENWVGLMPYLIMLVGAMGSMLLGTVHFGHGPKRKLPLFFFSFLAVVAAGIWSATHIMHGQMILFGGMMRVDYFSSLFNMMLSGATLLVMLGCFSYLENEHIHFSEFYPILIVSTLGMMLLAAAIELLTIFVSLELMSLAVYVLVGMRRKDARSNEASVKYFVMGGVAAAIFLYGTSFIYGALNTTRLADIAMMISHDPLALQNPILLTGLVFVTVAFLFKVAVVPFHMWTPDVYEGAPTLITGYMATALKAAVFAAFIRVAATFFGDHSSVLSENAKINHDIIWVLALVTMVLGNFVALTQNNLKRLLAYSAIAHTGYLLVGILAGARVGYSSLVFYLVAYIAMNLGAFGILALLGGKEDKNLTVESTAGLANRKPWAAAALTVFLLSLGGMPPTAGFVAKYFIFSAAIEAGEVPLVLLGVLTSAVAIFYYLRIVVNMYMKESATQQDEGLVLKNSVFAFLSIAICVLLTIHLGIFPGQLLHAMKHIALF